MSEIEKPQLERPRFRKTKSVIAGFIGTAVTAGMTYGGYKVGEQLYDGNLVTLPSVSGLFFGLYAGATAASSADQFLSGEKPIFAGANPLSDKPSNPANRPDPTPPKPDAEPIPSPVAVQEAPGQQ